MRMTTLKIKLLNKRMLVFFAVGCAGIVAYYIFSQILYHDRKWKYKNIPTLEFWGRYLRSAKKVQFCRGILKNDELALKHAMKYMDTHEKKPIPARTFVEHLKNSSECDRFREQRGYFSVPLSEKEAKFPLAYSIVMYKDIEQVERLLRSIYMPQNYYCIHVDKKAPKEIHDAISIIIKCFQNVFIASSLEDVRWGSYTMMKADLNCMKDLLKYADWRYFINLTGQEFPLVSNRQLVDDFTKLNNTNFISSGIEKGAEFIDRTKYIWVNRQKTNKKKGDPPYNMTLTKGSLHNFFTRDCVDYVINNEVPRHFLKWLEDTFAPEETYFASLHHNKHLQVPGSHTGTPREPIDFNFRYVLWNTNHNVCAGKWVRDVCVTGIGDLHKALSSGGVFINKLYLDFQPLALDCLEEHQRNSTLRSMESKLSTSHVRKFTTVHM